MIALLVALTYVVQVVGLVVGAWAAWSAFRYYTAQGA